MPILIKQLHIRINVDNEDTTIAASTGSRLNKEEIVAECVEQVMDIMNNLKER